MLSANGYCAFASLPCDAWTTIGTWVLAFATIGLVLATWNLIRRSYQAAQQQIEAMRQTTERQLASAREAATERTREETRRLASALLAEVREVRERYLDVFGRQIQDLKPGQPAEITRFATSQNFFAVYDNNTGKLGLLAPEDISLIVRAITLVKSHTENVNEADKKISEWSSVMLSSAHAGQFGPAQIAERKREELKVEVGRILRAESTAVLGAIGEAIQALEKYIRPACQRGCTPPQIV